MPIKKFSLPRPRVLKIGYNHYERRNEDRQLISRSVPFLRLSGDWLQNAGFTVGQRVRVHIAERCITIILER